MQIHPFLFCVICSLLSPVFSDEDYVQIEGCCTFKGPDLKETEYIIFVRYNKIKVMEYNSTRGNWTAFTPYSIGIVPWLNRDPYNVLQRATEKTLLCTDNINSVKRAENFVFKPTIKLHSVKQSTDGHPGLLVCSAYNFYPKQIQVTWLQNGEEVTSGVSCSEVVSDEEWYHQVHCYLEYTLTSGDTITCMVEHASLSEPVLQVWSDSLPVPEQIKIAVGLCGLMLGLVVVTSGFFYYRKKSAARVAQCQRHLLTPINGLTEAAST